MLAKSFLSLVLAVFSTVVSPAAELTLRSPLDFQVVQRQLSGGIIQISGLLENAEDSPLGIEARLTGDTEGAWKKLPVTASDATSFNASMEAPAGVWYRLEVRISQKGAVIAENSVAHVGIGEIFVVAGQSNSANHGSEKLIQQTGLVANFDGQQWQPANDPQPGASGGGGSFMSAFGDAIAKQFKVPVGIVACGQGSTSVRHWLPKGSKSPSAPTNANPLPEGGWESDGVFFENLVARMKQLGPNGFRAVLWHQGESDANQADSTRTLPGQLYRNYLEKIIKISRQRIGWEAPWFIAQASYHSPSDEGSADIRDAQASLWKDGIALEGVDSDALKSEFRENDGKGVHFSGAGLREHGARWAAKISPWLVLQTGPGE